MTERNYPPVAQDPSLSRRDLLQRAGLGVLGLSLPGSTSGGAAPRPLPARGNEPTVAFVPLNRFPRDVHEYYVRRAREVERVAEERRAALRTKADAEAYVLDVRQKIHDCFGPWPEKTPLHARVTGVVRREFYRIEKVIFESRPGFPVTANLYVPTERAGPMPAVIGTCGHSTNGKASAAYQAFAQGLARQGYVTLIFDPIGQGERLQHLTPEFQPRHGVAAVEHSYLGKQMVLNGEFFGSWLVWDGIRALDYLLSRPEVDPTRVGVTGNSGGGTQAAWLLGVEPRFTMGAPSCFVMTFRRNLENENVADVEQCPPRALALGLDHSDFIAAYAPRPVVLIGQENDFFDARGLEQAYRGLQRLYGLLGAGSNIRLSIGPDYHGFVPSGREAMYQWFNHVTHAPATPGEGTITVEKDETLWCTPRGHVAESRPKTVWSMTNERARALQAARVAPGDAALPELIRSFLKLPARVGVPDYRILRPNTGRKYPMPFAATYTAETEPLVYGLKIRTPAGTLAATYVVETEPEIHTVVYRLSAGGSSAGGLWSRPPRGFNRAVLYISHLSADAEMRDEPLLQEIIAAEPDAAIFACDVRGIGESQTIVGGLSHSPNAINGADYFHAVHGLMLDYPTAGQRTHDILRVIDWLKDCGHGEIHVVAKGWGTIPGAFAAMLESAVVQVTLKHALTSYGAIAESADYNWPLSSLLPGVLRAFDLPDCYRALETRKLRLVEPWDAAAG